MEGTGFFPYLLVHIVFPGCPALSPAPVEGEEEVMQCDRLDAL